MIQGAGNAASTKRLSNFSVHLTKKNQDDQPLFASNKEPDYIKQCDEKH